MVHVELLFSGLSKHQDWYPCPDKYKSHTGDHYLRVSTSQHTSTGDSTRQILLLVLIRLDFDYVVQLNFAAVCIYASLRLPYTRHTYCQW